ncbi:YciI family protein [Granulosicoccus sp.]|nr:YciI family protein [Granulosicoccus sp.]
MPKYLCIQRSPASSEQSTSSQQPSPAQMEQMMAKFNSWRETFKNEITDMGGPLDRDGRVVKAEGTTDGPFVEVKELIGGYMIVKADNMDAAVKVVEESPGVSMPGSSVEVREIKSM